MVFVVSQSYYVRVTSKIQVNFRFNRCSRVLMIGSHGFSWFLYSLRFWGQGIHFFVVPQSYYVWVTSKIQVNFRFYRSSRVLMIGSYGFSKFFSFSTFSRSRNPFFIVSQSYYVQSTPRKSNFISMINWINVDLVFWGYRNMVAWWNCKNSFLDPENVGNKEITKIHKSQSSIPSSTCETGKFLVFQGYPNIVAWWNCKKMDSLTPKT